MRGTWIWLAFLGLVACTDSSGNLSRRSPDPAARWIYRTMLREAGGLDGFSQATEGLPPRPRRRIVTDQGSVLITSAAPEGFDWVEIGPGHFRFVEEDVDIEVQDELLCGYPSVFDEPGCIDERVVVQHELLQPTEGFSPGNPSEDFELVNVDGSAARVGAFESWAIEGDPDDALRAPTSDVLAQISGVLGAQVDVQDTASRFTLHGQSRGPWWGRVSKAIDPRTGEILAADVFVNPTVLHRRRSEIRDRLRTERDELRARAEVARTQVYADAARRRAPDPELLARLRRATVESYPARFSTFEFPPPEVEEALRSIEVEQVIRNETSPVLDHEGTPALELISAMRSAEAAGAGWGDGQLYPAATGPVEWAGWLVFDEADRAAENLEGGLLEHVVLAGVLRALGLEPNLAGSRDVLNFPARFWMTGDLRFATSSVLDDLAPEARAVATALGPYDVAALRWLYHEEIAAFDDPLEGLSGLDVADLPVRLCGDCGPEEVAARLSARSYVAAGSRSRKIDFMHCGVDEGLDGSNPACVFGDFGPSARADLAMRRARWSLAFSFGFVPFDGAYIVRARTVVAALRAAAAATEHLRLGRGDEQDLFTAAAAGVDFGAALLTAPGPGRHCPWPLLSPSLYIPAQVHTRCDASVDIDSPTARAQGQIEVQPGLARPPRLWSDTYDVEIWGPGAALDAALAPWLFLAPAGGEAPAAALSDLFLEHVSALFAAYGGADVIFLRPRDTEALGALWCPGGEVPGFGPALARSWSGGPSPCSDPGFVLPELRRVTLDHMLMAGRLLPGLAPRLEVYEMSEPAAGRVAWDALPDGYCEVQDPVEGRVFRGIGADSIACARVAIGESAVQYRAQTPSPLSDQVVSGTMASLALLSALRSL